MYRPENATFPLLNGCPGECFHSIDCAKMPYLFQLFLPALGGRLFPKDIVVLKMTKPCCFFSGVSAQLMYNFPIPWTPDRRAQFLPLKRSMKCSNESSSLPNHRRPLGGFEISFGCDSAPTVQF